MPRIIAVPLRATLLIGLAAYSGVSRADGPAKPEVLEAGTRATALVEVDARDRAATGSAFCIDKSGLFVTNAHVVEAADGGGKIKLVVDIGRKEQRSLPAKTLRRDDDLDLALLKVDPDPRFVPLPIGKDDTLRHTAQVVTFGFPFGHMTAVARGAAPDISVLPSRITALRKEGDRLRFVQFDGQLNPGNSGGPVLDDTGKVVGVAVMTVRGAGLNLAIPAGVLAGFLESLALEFDPPPLAYTDRSRPTTWTIKVLPANPSAKIPDGLAVVINVGPVDGEPHTVVAQSTGGGIFKATVTPVPLDPQRKVGLMVHGDNNQVITLEVKDATLAVGGRKLMLSDIARLDVRSGGAILAQGRGYVQGQVAGLGTVKTKAGTKTVSIDLGAANWIDVRPLAPPPPVRAIAAVVELKQGGKVLATARRVADISGAPNFGGGPGPRAVVAGPNRVIVVTPAVPSQGLDDSGLLKVGTGLAIDGVPLGSGREVRPPDVAPGPAQVAKEPPPQPERSRTRPVAGPEGVRVIASNGANLYSLGFSPDGKTLAIGGDDNAIRLIDAATGRESTRFIQNGWVQSISFSADGKSILAAAYDKRILVCDLARRVISNPVHDAGLKTDRAFAVPGGKRVVAVYNDEGQSGRSVRLWDLATGESIASLRLTGSVLMAATPDGKTVVLVSSSPMPGRPGLPTARQAIRALDAATGATAWTVDLPGTAKILAAAVSADASALLTFGADGAVVSRTLADGKEARRLAIEGMRGQAAEAAFSPDGLRLATSQSDSNLLRIWDLADGRELARVSLMSHAGYLTFAPDGSRVAAGTFRTTGAIWAPAGLIASAPPTAPAPSPGEPTTRLVGGTIRDVAVGGGGRYLVLLLNDPARVAVFDAQAGDVVKSFSLASTNALIAAGAHRFVVAYPDEKLIHRYDFATMARTGGGASPIRGRLRGLTMGSDSDGPMLAWWSPPGPSGPLEQSRFSFLDLESLAAKRVGSLSFGGFQGLGALSKSGASFALHPFLQQNVHLRASGGGGLFALWQTGSSPSGFQTVTPRGGSVRAVYNHESFGHLAPGGDGVAIFTARGGRRDAEGSPIGEAPPQGRPVAEAMLPTPDPTFYLAATLIKDGVPSVSVHSAGDGARLFTVVGIDEMAALSAGDDFARDDFTTEKRFHFIPAAKLLVTIPPTNDRLFLRSLDVDESLARLGVDYLYVESPSTLLARAGQPLEHRLSARSKARGITYALESGPDGLAVSTAGR